METNRGYSFAMRFIHWLMAILMFYTIAAMLIVVYKPFGKEVGKSLSFLYDHHRAMGFVILLLVIVRVILKFTSKPPSPLPDTISPLQKKIAHITHILLYGALSIHPLLGWYATNAWGVKNIPFFGIWTLPQLTEKNRELGNQLLAIHTYVGFFIIFLIFAHIGAALMHHFIKKDNVLLRMMKT